MLSWFNSSEPSALGSKQHIIGNTVEPNGQGSWNWTFYIRPAEYIEEVIVELHPTFKNPRKTLRGSTIELSCTGWGTFELGVSITWRGGQRTETKWMLKFSEDQSDFHEELLVPAGVISLGNPAPECYSDAAVPDATMRPGGEQDRLEYLASVMSSPAIDPGADPSGQSWHGRLVKAALPRPSMTWESRRRPREDKHGKDDVPEWLSASEYRDDAQTLAYKVRLLASLLSCSKKTLAYTGAGLSVAAGIGQAAVGSAKAKACSSLEANPTVAHRVMAELNTKNLLHAWVQQNHDGLPQKAGYRQEDINEIHGSWYDPSNPVVLYSGSLRDDLYKDMAMQAKTADLVLVMGTSLSGLNADQCATKAARRSLPGRAVENGSLGSVIISPQRSPEDGEASLRFFATADEVMTALAKEFGIQVETDPAQRRACFSSELRVKVPYDRNGKRSQRVCTWWDLRPGAKLRVSNHNNIEGAQQPAYLGITPELVGEALAVDQRTACLSIRFPGRRSTMQLGIWWIDAALRGGPEYLPVVNPDGVEEPLRR